MRVLMHIIPHIAMIGLCIFVNIIGYSRRISCFCDDGDAFLYTILIYIFLLSWLPSVLVETFLY